jgi:hypothetical protein
MLNRHENKGKYSARRAAEKSANALKVRQRKSTVVKKVPARRVCARYCSSGDTVPGNSDRRLIGDRLSIEPHVLALDRLAIDP